MDIRKPVQTVLSVPLGRLAAHPANPNHMSNATFHKLVRHLAQTGRYEPIVVRPLPGRPGTYQILNGHHRVRALKRLGKAAADCVVFDADDTEALVYLATLNRLRGRSSAAPHRRLIEQLCRRRDSPQLARLLGESRTAIEKLRALARQEAPAKASPAKAFLTPMTFFVTDGEQRLLSEAFARAVSSGESGTRTEKRLRALCRLARHYLERDD